MDLIQRYIFRIASGAFVSCLVVLTAVIWITQALRELDLITGKGQTIITFLTVTFLSVPTLITVISPVALFIATLYALNKLNGDSELIVMSAAGMRPGQVLRPFLTLAASVSFLVTAMTLYVMPASFQELHDLLSKIRGDFVANIVKEGQFSSLDNGVTFYYRERSGATLLGILMQDTRDENRTVVYLAERGQILDKDGQTYLVLENGSIHRQQPNSRESSIVAFERYAIDLSALTPEGADTIYKPRERSTGQLLFPDRKDAYYQLQAGRFRSELHDRLSIWLLPLTMMLVAFAALGEVRTTRQGRGAATAIAVGLIVAIRIAGFAASSAVVRSPWAALWVYALPLGCSGIALLLIMRGAQVRMWMSRHFGWLFGLVRFRLPRIGRA